ncbi:MAG: hypothetical protein ACLQU5_09585, partial [Isosphaeraceae bacterium]
VKKGDVIQEGIVHDVRLVKGGGGGPRQEILVKPHTTASKAKYAEKRKIESAQESQWFNR